MNLLKKILKYPVVLAFFLFIFLFTAGIWSSPTGSTPSLKTNI